MAASIEAAPWISFGDTGICAPLSQTQGLPLTGVRVLDLTRVLAGPACTRLLALLGADVLRVDRPDRPELPDQHLDTGAGKRSATADLREAGQLARLHELLAAADVLVTGYRPGALNTLGLGPDDVRSRHPHLVQVSLSAWGTQGLWARERGFDSIVQSCIGIGHTYGSSDEEGNWRPGALPVQALDLATGYGMAAAVMGLLATRAERGAGSAALSLASTGHLLMNAGEPAERTPQELAVETMTTPTPQGLLTHVGAPAMIDGHGLHVPPPGPYAGSPLSWW
jgi:crotonobetainyl-CoA:carnitine CoA-transferase CaiB-like acyl-CoA transferase